MQAELKVDSELRQIARLSEAFVLFGLGRDGNGCIGWIDGGPDLAQSWGLHGGVG